MANYWKGLLGVRIGGKEALDKAIDDMEELLKKDGVSPYFQYVMNDLLIERYRLEGDIERALLEFDDFAEYKTWTSVLEHYCTSQTSKTGRAYAK